MTNTQYIKKLEKKILHLETRIKHLTNDLNLTKEEYETTTAKYFDLYSNMEKKVEERIAELKKLQKILEAKNLELQRSEEQYRMLFNSGNDSIYVYEIEDGMPGNFIEVNNIACQRLGFSRDEFLKLSPIDIDASEKKGEIPQIMKKLLTDKHLLFEQIHITKSGDRIPIETSAHLIEIKGKPAVLAIARDITERKRMEMEMQKSQKLESIGILAGGIAHDFNNLLTIILGNTQLSQMMIKMGRDVGKYLQKIEDGVEQATSLTQQLLTFSKGGKPVKKIGSIADLIKETANLAICGLNERCVLNITDDLWTVEVDKGQITQVLNNLIINADQAMPDGGEIYVSAENVDSDSIDSHYSLPKGKYIKISIQDQGIGIPSGQLVKIFDPYFTTKQKGSGLGLSVAYSIIEKHDGLITVNSELGVGTTFEIYLPAVESKVMDIPKKQASYLNGTGKIMVMDDEEFVREFVSDLLKGEGYQVECVKDGTEAINLYKNAADSGKPFNVLIMDLTIPGGMGGRDAIRRIKEMDPKAKGIVSSGYSNDPIMSSYKEYGFSGVLTKPYRYDDLMKTLYDVEMAA